ncbi:MULTISPECIES: TetR/AcrR family transcriptional regulator [Flavobacteriaceae]|jgi:AcrR family transcriptional regulator|uniref:TetR/AcrR family transcriptional regulator n=1 Tax=Winogradskyella aquimaris TaxID=864074 RepID=A0ABU5ERY2_9FLAO|nr:MULTISPECIES: TetR/AcrR family transcriptional regulator [Flavobacteriaceae]MDY2588495.1 TetR/AcrR family transcriptional regulator [Winogradskyella aquimaris]|tara:strand:+ start:1999 stop:2535 length:537 start_codon:yes stop_codon:yes gene_type:complete
MKKKTQKPVDRRIQKSKKYLSDAFIALILEKGYEAVTVQEIIDRANVGRSTFYAHFESKEQLLFSLLGTMNEKSKDGIDFEMLFNHCADNFQIAKAMLGKKGGDLIIGHIRDVMSLKIAKDLKRDSSKSKSEQLKIYFTSEALSAALVSYLTNWLDEDMPYSSEEMSAKCNELVEKFT